MTATAGIRAVVAVVDEAATSRTCNTFECRDVGAPPSAPSAWLASSLAVTVAGTSTNAICPYMARGSMVDDAHFCANTASQQGRQHLRHTACK